MGVTPAHRRRDDSPPLDSSANDRASDRLECGWLVLSRNRNASGGHADASCGIADQGEGDRRGPPLRPLLGSGAIPAGGAGPPIAPLAHDPCAFAPLPPPPSAHL